MTRRLVDIYSGVVEGRVLLAFPGAVNSLRFTPGQAKIMARKLWLLAEECELARKMAEGAVVGEEIPGADRASA
jgi:hypothetical protein